MSILKNTLLYAGWIPALAGGSTAVWWLESDKTIEDVLRRTGQEILWSKGDFEKVYNSFMDEDWFIKDIEGVETTKWKGVADWCDENLSLPINEENLRKVLPKAQKYCTGRKVISSGAKNFNNFSKVFDLLEKSKREVKKMSAVSIIHLGETESEDTSYFYQQDGVDFRNSDLIANKSPRRNSLGRFIFVSDEYDILETSYKAGKSGEVDAIWNRQAEEYNKAKPEEKIPDLKDAFEEKVDKSKITAYSDGKTRVNQLRVRCLEFLKQRFEDKASHDKAQKHFMRWCAVKKPTSGKLT